MVDCTALERRHVRLGHRGFESLSFRHIEVRYCRMQCRIFCFFKKIKAFLSQSIHTYVNALSSGTNPKPILVWVNILVLNKQGAYRA